MALTNFPERTAALSSLMRDWAKQDPAAALEMAASLPAASLKQEAFDAACAGWASEHPDTVAK